VNLIFILLRWEKIYFQSSKEKILAAAPCF